MLIPATYFTLDDFLLPEEMNAIWRYVISKERDFEVTQVKPPSAPNSVINYSYRKSRVLMALGPHREFLALRLRSYLASAVQFLQYRPFKVSQLDIQVTATNDGEYFRAHCDSGSFPYLTRQITFVLYFNRAPKSFTGGELVLYDTEVVGEEQVSEGSSLTIAPRHNQIIFFPSCLLHEVRPVACPSRQFRDSRFTVNGWFHSSPGSPS